MTRHRHSGREWWSLVQGAVVAWVDDYAPSMGAALAYYSVFSMGPLLVIVISIAGLMFGAEAARGEVFAQLSGLLGADSAKAVEDTLSVLGKPSHGLASTAIGAVALLIGATSVFGELQNALDRIWRAPHRSASGGLWGLLRARLLSFGMILGVAFLLMVSLVVSAAISALGKWWGGFFAEWEVLLQLVNTVVGFGLTTAVFAMIYKLMPRATVEWHDVWLGAATTSVLFTVGRFLIGLYIGKSGIASGFGAAGSIAVIFVWVYYSAQIFLLGAEFTWVYANRFGSLSAANAPISASAPVVAAASSASMPAAESASTASVAAAARDENPARTPVDLEPAASHAEPVREPPPSILKIVATLTLAAVIRFVLPRVLSRVALKRGTRP